ncbi:hypothetical protein BAE44_0006572 [Dichanthelium oligosanthes]|uniref:Uncharacterized protein n=1 Tax=Dichanthelium oligosanthes TaxID=888268 RepID=A0A1E5W4R5_9POAL|nr:hypothetical protein BAE44_0006572 [Dichanthelium oligosanthes]
MALITYNSIDIAFKEGATFIFGSWVCTADGMGGFSSYLADSASTLPHTANSPNVLHDLVDKLSNLDIADQSRPRHATRNPSRSLDHRKPICLESILDSATLRQARDQCGFWVCLRGEDQGDVVQEGIDFAQDSEVGGGDDFLFVSDSEDFSEDIDDGIFVPDSENPGAACAPFTAAPQSVGSFITNTKQEQMDGIEEQRVVAVDEQLVGVKSVAWQDITGHAQPPEEEADVDDPEPQELEDDGINEFCEVRDSMLMTFVPYSSRMVATSSTGLVL